MLQKLLLYLPPVISTVPLEDYAPTYPPAQDLALVTHALQPIIPVIVKNRDFNQGRHRYSHTQCRHLVSQNAAYDLSTFEL